MPSAVADLVGIEVGEVSGMFNLELYGVERQTGDHAMKINSYFGRLLRRIRIRGIDCFSTNGLT